MIITEYLVVVDSNYRVSMWLLIPYPQDKHKTIKSSDSEQCTKYVYNTHEYTHTHTHAHTHIQSNLHNEHDSRLLGFINDSRFDSLYAPRNWNNNSHSFDSFARDFVRRRHVIPYEWNVSSISHIILVLCCCALKGKENEENTNSKDKRVYCWRSKLLTWIKFRN